MPRWSINFLVLFVMSCKMSALTSLRPSFKPVPAPSDTDVNPPSQNFDSYPTESTVTKRMRLDYDVSIRVDNTVFNCNRAVLSKHSEYFDKTFRCELKESSMSEICLEEYVDVGIFGNLLKSFYSGHGVEITDENVFPMLWNSSYLLISEVVEKCVAHVLRRTDCMRADHMLKAFVFSRRMNFVPLVDHLRGYLLQNFFDLSRCDSFYALPFDEMIQLLTEYKSIPSSEPFSWKHGEIYSLYVLVQYMRRSFSEKRPPSELEELIRMTNSGEIPTEFAKLMMTELEFRFPFRTALRTPKPRLEFYLRTFVRNTKDEVIDKILPRFRAIDSARIPPIHAFVQRPRSMSVYSISRLEPVWSVSLSRKVPAKLFYERPKSHTNSRTDQPFNSFQCFTLTNDVGFIYSLKNSRVLGGMSETFQVHSSIDIFSSYSLDLAPPPICLVESVVCGLKTSIYFYQNSRHRRTLINQHPKLDLNFTGFEVDDILCYHRECDKWVPLPQPQFSSGDAFFVADENLAYLMGGCPCCGPSFFQAYDDRMSGWFPLPSRTNYLQKKACFLNGKIYAFNGKELERYDPVAGNWDVCLGMLHHSIGGQLRQMLAYGNQLWCFSDSREAEGSVFVYDTISEEIFVNRYLMDAVENDCKEEKFALVNILTHNGELLGTVRIT